MQFGLDCRELCERLSNLSCGLCVVVDQLSRFLGELLRSREIGGGLSFTLGCVEAFELGLQRVDLGFGDLDFCGRAADHRIHS